jgi:hypothetical protein
VKNAKRLDYAGLAEVLGQREVVDAQRLRIALESSRHGPSPFPEVLVSDDLVGDWELSRVVCELYGLPFVPPDIHEPDLDLLEGLDCEFLREHRLVPLSRHGDLLTVAMPGLVPAEVLGSLASDADVHVLPVVGSVESNNRWIDQHLTTEQAPALPSEQKPATEADQGWSNIFDEGDANVLMGLDDGLEEDLALPAEPAPQQNAGSEFPPLPAPPED